MSCIFTHVPIVHPHSLLALSTPYYHPLSVGAWTPLATWPTPCHRIARWTNITSHVLAYVDRSPLPNCHMYAHAFNTTPSFEVGVVVATLRGAPSIAKGNRWANIASHVPITTPLTL
nr:hypothetical protein Iba_chr03aCG20170 [Ipomoea batatas]